MYYKALRLPFDPWKGLPDHYFSKDVHKIKNVFNKYVNRTDFNKETIDWFTGNGLYLINNSMLFSYLPHHKTSIHTDGHGKTNDCMYSAINFSIGGAGSIEWHEPLDSSDISPLQLTAVAKSPYHYIDRNKAKLLDTYEIKNPVLIDVATYHCGINDSDEHRYSLTLRWMPKTTFQQSLEIFKPYFLE
jgi:hypothetical protein